MYPVCPQLQLSDYSPAPHKSGRMSGSCRSPKVLHGAFGSRAPIPSDRWIGYIRLHPSSPSTSSMLLTLPQETVNEIIAHLRSDDRALRSLSVASKRLTEECRRYLFASICIDSWQKFTRWSDAIPPGEDGLSRYVRELDLDTTVIWTKVPWLPDLHTIYLRSFTQVEQLKIRPLDLHRVVLMDMVDNLESFFPTVRLLSIRPTGDYSTILKFLALFPHLETTCITSPSIHEDREIADPQNFVCRGNLVIKACRISPHANILSCLTRPTTCYRSISLGLVKVETFAPLERFFEICGGSLESIQFVSCILGKDRTSSLGASHRYQHFYRPPGPLPSYFTFPIDRATERQAVSTLFQRLP